MLLKELVLDSLDAFADFEVNGKTLVQDDYFKLADRTIKHWYLDINKKTGDAMACVTLEDY